MDWLVKKLQNYMPYTCTSENHNKIKLKSEKHGIFHCKHTCSLNQNCINFISTSTYTYNEHL